MGSPLLQQRDPDFRRQLAKIDALYQDIAHWSLLEEFGKGEHDSKIDRTEIAQPAIFAIQVALAEKWRAMGVTPQAMIGHSIGEVAASYFSGAFTLKEAIQLIYHRNRLQSRATGKGRMLAVGLSGPEAQAAIEAYADVVSVAAINGPAMVSLAGEAAALEEIQQAMESREIFTRFLQVDVPFHSHFIAPLKPKLRASLQHLSPHPTVLPFYSTVTGTILPGTELDADYWCRNMCSPVLFAPGIETLIDDGFNQFVEIGSHPTHLSGIHNLLARKAVQGVAVQSLRRQEDEETILH